MYKIVDLLKNKAQKLYEENSSSRLSEFSQKCKIV